MGNFYVARRGRSYYIMSKSDGTYSKGPYFVKSFAEAIADALNSNAWHNF